MKLLVMQSSPASRHFLPLRSEAFLLISLCIGTAMNRDINWTLNLFETDNFITALEGVRTIYLEEACGL
jgi:hypothetical protein